MSAKMGRFPCFSTLLVCFFLVSFHIREVAALSPSSPRPLNIQNKIIEAASQCEDIGANDQIDEANRPRRQVLSSLAYTSILSLTIPDTAKASSGSTVGETIRRSAANLPGLGPPDVYYPPSWQGSWNVTRSLQVPVSLQLEYKIRFISATPDSDDNGLIVADRGFNQAALETALKQQSSSASSNSNNNNNNSPIVQSYEWVKTNPNDLRLVLVDGTRKDIKVTKRATQMDDLTVQSSEYQRIVIDQITTNVPSVPSISARRILCQWKQVSPNVLEAMELVYDMGTNMDPMRAAGGAATTSSEPKLLTKSKLVLQRIS